MWGGGLYPPPGLPWDGGYGDPPYDGMALAQFLEVRTDPQVETEYQTVIDHPVLLEDKKR
jgi:hypothetical protein